MSTIADPITTEVIRNFVVSCAQDMNAALYRSAFSSVIYEGRDSAVALLDRNGDMLGQSTGVPIFIGNIDVCVRAAIDRYGDTLEAGDVVIMNDPYLQGTHTHDVTVVGPIFYEGQRIGFAASRAHWQDVGGMDAGTIVGSTSIYDEGLRLGPTRIVRRGQPDRDWFDMLRSSTRLKEMLIGDLNAQIAAIRTGERRVAQMLDRVGVEVFESACRNIFRQSDELDRAAILAIADGTYVAEGYMDNDGFGTDPVPVKVSLTVAGERLKIDLTGTSGPVIGSINCGAAQTLSMIRLACKAMISPDSAITGGSFQTVDVVIPELCVFNAHEPAACEWYASGLGLLADLLMNCFGQASPEKAMGANYGDSMVVSLVGLKDRQVTWIVVEPTAGGWGGYDGYDGESALINLSNGAFRNIPAEVYEIKHPVRIEQFSFRKDSGGAGRWRGGCGVVRSYRLLDDCTASIWFERSKTPGWGILGGESGQPPTVTISGPGVESDDLKVKARSIPKGALIKTETGGGGGFGPVADRPTEAVLEDVLDGYVTIEGARRNYHVVICPETRTVDHEATASLRAAN